MKRLILLLMTLISLQTSAQKFQTAQDVENNSIIMKGSITMADLSAEKTFTWLRQNAAYTPDAATLDQLKAKLPAYDIVVVMGTWCEDSQNLFPKLYTVLEQAAYPMDHLKIFGVDRTKDALNGEKAKYSIEKVPTIILFSAGKEVGRITETVQKSIEADLNAIIQK